MAGQVWSLQKGFNSLATSGDGWGQGGKILVSTVEQGVDAQATNKRQERISKIRVSNFFLLHKFSYI